LSHVLHIVIDFIHGFVNVISISVKATRFFNKEGKYSISTNQEAAKVIASDIY